jgi:prepilin-type N-terminal cleavage/methylation domain-containing protein/prepilin-type processing-associated H-X9-DG protein
LRLKSGFTLIELLVVIAIISVLAAILFPVYATVRENARKTACLSNLRQIGTAARLYVQDYDETLFPPVYRRTGPAMPYSSLFYVPSWVSWPELLQPYTASVSIFTCPDRPDTPGQGYSLNGNSSGEVFPGEPTPPGNWNYGGTVGSYSPTMADIAADAKTIWFYDSTPNVLFITKLMPWEDLEELGRERPTSLTLLNVLGSRLMAQILKDAGPRADNSTVIKDPWRHNQGMNITWCDGHASFNRPSTLSEKSWNIEQIAQPAE